jgi:hypothetical protein
MLDNAALGYPILWPGRGGTPPNTGIWLQVQFQPNQGIDNGLGPNDKRLPQGIFQVSVFDRPSAAGWLPAQGVAQQVIDTFPKNATIVDLVRVQREPYTLPVDSMDDRLEVVVTIPYTG